MTPSEYNSSPSGTVDALRLTVRQGLEENPGPLTKLERLPADNRMVQNSPWIDCPPLSTSGKGRPAGPGRWVSVL